MDIGWFVGGYLAGAITVWLTFWWLRSTEGEK